MENCTVRGGHLAEIRDDATHERLSAAAEVWTYFISTKDIDGFSTNCINLRDSTVLVKLDFSNQNLHQV